MKTAFIETSAINWCHRNGITGIKLSTLLEKNSLTPLIGPYTSYELARNFLTNDPKNTNQLRTRALFNLIKELNPIFICQRHLLLEMELKKLRSGQSTDPLMQFYSKQILTQRIEDLCAGNLNQIHEQFVNERQAWFQSIRNKIWTPLNIDLLILFSS